MRALSLQAILLTALLAAPATATTPRLVIVGIADVDATTTQLKAIDLDAKGAGAVVDIGVLHHGAGDTPTGVLVDGTRLVTVSPRDGELRLYDLQTHEERSLATGFMKNQRPVLTTTTTATTTTKGASIVVLRPVPLPPGAIDQAFEIVVIGPFGEKRTGAGVDAEIDADIDVAVIATTGPRTWATVVPQARRSRAPASTTITVLTIDAGSDVARLFDVEGTRLRSRALLGAGVFRQGTLRADGRFLVERERTAGTGSRSSLVQLKADGRGEETVAAGLPGLSPIVGGLRAAGSTGNKDGSIVVDEGAGFVRWPGARVGVARPQAMTAAGGVVVVTNVYRGQSLPTELWALTKNGGHALLTPPARTVVTVYGVIEVPQ